MPVPPTKVPEHPLLFHPRAVGRELPKLANYGDVLPEHQRILYEWALTIRDGSILKRGEKEIRSAFIEKILCGVLGYTSFGSAADFSLKEEARTGSGAADVALGRFGPQGDHVMAPVELKGPAVTNLDLMMPGRHKSPVQQVWEYAMDTPGCQFLVLSNMVEIRLYAVGHTRRVYERFDLVEVSQSPREYLRLRLALDAVNLLQGHTARLLADSAVVEKEITRQLYQDYKQWRVQLIIALAEANAQAPAALIAPAQKLLDRVLFIAFSQQRGLLPPGTLQEVHRNNDWVQRPKYDQYKGLFAAVDKGLPARNIPPYNGGLFASDAFLDALALPDGACDTFAQLARYDFGSEVSVNVLGHIFEQSITDIEALQTLAGSEAFSLQALKAQARAQDTAKDKAGSDSGARKTHGIVYTPEFITAFIIEQTLGKTLEGRRIDCLVRYQIQSDPGAADAPQSRWRAPTAQEKKTAPKKMAIPEALTELCFWRAWRAELADIKVCDPACGSGAFLVAAFDALQAEYEHIAEQIVAITGTPEVWDADREILNNNLYGVDLNAESIEITKLSLWLKTARHGKPLASLEHPLRVGNSIISSADGGLDYDKRAFDWASAFPEIIARGGFDVVIGNPPYVRQERISPFKPYLQERYACFDGAADLYAYFFELGIRLLRNGSAGGRLGYVSSSTFFKTASGYSLRAYLLAHAQLESVVDFGDLQIFEGVTTYPMVMTLRRSGSPQAAKPFRFLKIEKALPEKLAQSFSDGAAQMPQGQLDSAGWRLEDQRMANLRQRMQQGHPALREVYGSPLYGLKTGLNEAFVVDAGTARQFLQDPRNQVLLKPFLRGEDLKPWRAEPQGEYLLLVKNGSTRANLGLQSQAPLAEAAAWAAFSHSHPAVAAWLRPFEDKARKRTDQGEFWWELRACAYYDQFDLPKIAYVDMSDKPNFSLETSGAVLANTGYFIPGADGYLLALLNSRALWFLLRGMTTAYRGGFYRLFTQHVEMLPVPQAHSQDYAAIAALAEAAQTAAEARRDELRRFGRMVLRDLAPGGLDGAASLGGMLVDGVPAFAAFTQEVKKRFKRSLSLPERNEWDAALAAARARVAEADARIAQCEQGIDQVVYRLFGLSAAEIQLIEAKI